MIRTSNRTINHTIKSRIAMSTISANDLKTKGVSIIESALQTSPEVSISVRGATRYVVMELAQYQYLRECELTAALAEVQSDLASGNTIQESPEAHVQRIRSQAR